VWEWFFSKAVKPENMPKIKTRKGVAKRVKASGGGKLISAKGGGCVVGLTYSDNALFGKDDSSAVPMGGSLRSHTDRIAFLVPGDACRRGTAFGYEPGR